jgi:hypothetical protein
MLTALSRRYVSAACALFLMALSACSDNADPPRLDRLQLTVPSSTLVSGQTVAVTVEARDQFGAVFSPGAVSWSSSATAVATVVDGQVTGVGPGTASIRATVGTVVGELAVTVNAPVLTTLSVSASITSLQPGQTTTAVAAGTDQLGRPLTPSGVTWASSAPTIATVDATTGRITAVAAGPVSITASAGGRTASVAITVIASPAIVINEIESNGGTPGDWVELYNGTSAAVDLSGWGFKDNDDTRTFTLPTGTTIAAGGYLVIEEAQFNFGLGAPDAARLYNRFGALVDGFSWTAHAATTLTRCANGTGAFVVAPAPTKGAANDCRPSVRINEVESNLGAPGDWIELINIGTAPVDLSNFIVKDDDNARNARIPAGTTLQPGALYVIDEAQFGFGLGAADAARLFDAAGGLIDSYAWTAHATTTYGRCPDGTGAFVTTGAVTRGARNDCSTLPPPPTSNPWPGDNTVRTVDAANTFSSNLSGLTYETPTTGGPVLWAARNGPGSIYRMVLRNGTWVPDTDNGWSAGKSLRYPDGTGEADAEGLTLVNNSAAGGAYVAAERNNSANAVSRNSILRYDVSGGSTTLTATHEWNLTADLPATAPNVGVEAITWVPDAQLVAAGFVDEARNAPYAPANYPDHGTGLFLVGLEANGVIYAYALHHTTSTFTRIATITTGLAGVMGLEYDISTQYLWATCDDTCGNIAGVLTIDTGVASATRGRFGGLRRYARPTEMPNINNEGFAITPQSECVANRRSVFWSDDSSTGGFALRTGTIPCTTFSPLRQFARPLQR